MTIPRRRARVRAAWMTAAIAAVVVAGAVGTVHAVSAAPAAATTAATTAATAQSTTTAPSTTPAPSTTSAPASPVATASPTSTPSAASTGTTTADAPAAEAWKAYLATVPAVPGAGPADADELAGVFCQALASPTMSTGQYSALLALAEHEWSVTPDEATGLLTHAAADACPAYSVVVSSRGAVTPPSDTASVAPGDA